MSFQDNLKKYREEAGYMSAKEFAKLLDISYTTYMSYENKGSEPKYNILCKISQLLNISIDELLDNNPIDKMTRYIVQCNKLGIGVKKISNSDSDDIHENTYKIEIKLSKYDLTFVVSDNEFINTMLYMIKDKNIIAKKNKLICDVLENKFLELYNKKYSGFIKYKKDIFENLLKEILLEKYDIESKNKYELFLEEIDKSLFDFDDYILHYCKKLKDL